MDAPEDNRDVKLYRASGDLLPDIVRRLDELFKQANGQQGWVKDSQVQKLISLLETFQEWPQLLDPILLKIVTPLVDAFLQYLSAGYHEYQSQRTGPNSGSSPLPRAICCILNTLCKVRGVKVIAKFLNNEPRYLEPMLEMLLMNQSYMNWQERYIILLWSSHLVLTPFDLASISSSDKPSLMEAKIPEELESNRLPLISVALISAGLKNLGAASKERESASRLLVRVVLRPDMQRLGLLDKLVTLMYTKLQHYTQNPTASMYECLGFLSILSGITKSGSAQDTAPFLTTIFDFCLKAATDEEAKYGMIRTSAPARKMLIVILRTSTLHALSLYSRNGAKVMSEGNVYRMLEESIQYLLQALADKDTPVRFAASKALSMLCQSLDDDMKTEVVQAVLDTLEEDILYEKPESGNPVPATFLTTEERQKMSRNVMGVNPLKWQGLLLTLSQFLFRRTAPPDQLSPILGSLLSGLDFEQRSSSGTSIGGSVRDAACFGLWSLARKYATSELGSTDPTIVSPAIRNTISVNDKPSVLQTIANQLVVSACLDPSGNIRRGSSAALQELIGRHPDTIIHGIALVQAVDYHAVARRSHALVDVTRGAAELHDVYRWALLNALLGWRGIRAVDDDSRRTAALAITRLVSLGSFSDCSAILETAQEQLMRLPVQNSKTIAETRHGLLMTISCVLENLDSAGHRIQEAGACFSITSFLQLLWEHVRIDGQLFGNIKGRFTSELMLEGAARLISSLTCTEPEGHFKSFEQVIEVLDLCLTRADNDITLVACADAAFQLFSKLTVPQRAEVVDKWLKTDRQRHPSFSCKGRILAFGTVYSTLPEEALSDYSSQRDDCGSRVLAQVRDFIQGDWPIETQVIALRSLTSMISELTEEAVVEPLCAALDNYTNDQRGDVGSLARMEGVKGSSVLLSKYAEGGSSISNLAYVQPLVQRLFRLAGEKLDKLRFEAWKCIEAFLKVMKMQCNQSFSHVVDVSTDLYFSNLLQFLEVSWLQSSITQGIIHSMTSGTESLVRVSRLALIRSISDRSSSGISARILHILVTLLEGSYADDRQAVPLLETIAFVMEQLIELRVDEYEPLSRRLWNIVRKAHFKSTNVRKLDAAVSIYRTLAREGSMRKNGLCKLRDMLLHPYPSIRNAAADALYVEVPNDLLVLQDWSRPPKELKQLILRLNKEAPEFGDSA